MTDQQIAKWIDQLQGELDTLKRMAGSGGSSVTITPTLQGGEKLADYSIDGTEGAIYAPPIMDYYSATERVVGTWIDGRDVYEKTFYSETDISVSTTGADITGLADMVSVVDLFISAVAFYNGGKSTLPILLQNYNGSITAYSWMNAGINGIVMRYLKPASNNNRRKK